MTSDLTSALEVCLCAIQNFANRRILYVATGYNGSRCEDNPDDCVGVVCLHGTCVDGANDYTCQCEPGYTGRLCDREINECSSQPCLYNGTCVDLLNGYRCQCPTGTRGTSTSLTVSNQSFLFNWLVKLTHDLIKTLTVALMLQCWLPLLRPSVVCL